MTSKRRSESRSQQDQLQQQHYPWPTKQRWFHGSMSKEKVEKLLLERGVFGSFLVRESQSSAGDYSLAVRTRDENTQKEKISQLIIKCSDGKYDLGGGRKFNSLDELVEYYKRNPMVETDLTVVNMKHPFNSQRFVAIDISLRVNQLSVVYQQSAGFRDGFWEEFEQLQQQECRMLHDRKVGQELKNVKKNRYRNILPYDYSRVKLNRTSMNESNSCVQQQQFSPKPFSSQADVSGDNEESDYINANYIRISSNGEAINRRNQDLFPCCKTYIATQGPLRRTINDFWWMVWQENSDTIVMVTEIVERNKNKCSKYWPTINTLTQYGLVQVKTVNEHSENGYIMREFSISHNSVTRKVCQWQYLAWPDLNIPSEPKHILDFNERLNQSADPRVPIIVHCSAGVGRSGAFIIIDLIIDQLKSKGLFHLIDIQKIVKNARGQRSGLVQTEAQYEFVYLAVESFVKSMKKHEIQ